MSADIWTANQYGWAVEAGVLWGEMETNERSSHTETQWTYSGKNSCGVFI